MLTGGVNGPSGRYRRLSFFLPRAKDELPFPSLLLSSCPFPPPSIPSLHYSPSFSLPLPSLDFLFSLLSHHLPLPFSPLRRLGLPLHIHSNAKEFCKFMSEFIIFFTNFELT